jgi:hypothetical protein
MAIDTIGTNAIANDAVTAAKIPAGAVDADITAIPDGSVTTAKIADNAVTSAKALNLGRRNLVINGAFQCSQRGASTTGGGFLVDRFELNINNTDNIAITQSQDSSGPSGFANSWKILATTAESAVAADERVRFRQNIEGQNLQQFAFGTSVAKSMTLSFYVKSNKTGTYAVNLEQDDASRVIGSTYTISSADTWEFKTITVGGDTSGTINNDNGVGLILSWYLLAGSNYTTTDNTSYGASADGKQAYGHSTTWGQATNDNFFITGVQLEVGDAATDFEHRSFGEELLLCQRYYEHTYPYGTAAGSANGGIGADHRYVGRSTGNNYGYYTGHYRVEKRAAATVTVYSYAGTANQIAHGDTGGDSGAVGVIQNGTTSFLPRNTSGSGVSERALLYHFRADAEL